MRFIEFKHVNGVDAVHIAQARATVVERDFLRKFALTFEAVRDEPDGEDPERLLTTVREVWNIIALELEGAVLAQSLPNAAGPEARRLCHTIRDAVLRNRFHYHGIG